MGTILIVEDDEDERQWCRNELEKDGHVVHGAADSSSALEKYRNLLGQVDVIVLDLHLNDEHGKVGGCRLIESIREEILHVFPPRLVIRSNYGDHARTTFFDKLRYHATIQKVGSLSGGDRDLRRTVQDQCENLANAIQLRGNVEPFCDYFRTPYLGGGEFRRSIVNLAEKWRKDEVIFIHGPTGSGKGRLASVLHEYGPRFSGTFVNVNLAHLAPSLVESELFGHKKGAFTDAKTDYPGKLLDGAHGTIFLDELGYAEGFVQSRLLSFLESRNVVPVKGKNEDNKHCDAFVIVASQQPLAIGPHLADALAGRLKHLELRPLRERKPEIPAMMDYLRDAYYRVRGDGVVPAFSPEVYDDFISAEWRYNLRHFNRVLCDTFEATHQPSGGVDKIITRRHLPEQFLDSLTPKVQSLGSSIPESTPVVHPNDHADLSPASSQQLRPIDSNDPYYLDRLRGEFILPAPPAGYGLFDRVAAITMLRVLDLNKKNKAESARQLGILPERLKRLAKNYFSDLEYQRHYPPKRSEPEGDVEVGGAGEDE
jgi:DNA-binding NtrC family response regulator